MCWPRFQTCMIQIRKSVVRNALGVMASLALRMARRHYARRLRPWQTRPHDALLVFTKKRHCWALLYICVYSLDVSHHL